MGRRRTKPVLDEAKRQELVALLIAGCSQTAAMHYAGCSPSLIQRAAEEDPAFAERLRHAIRNTEVGLIKSIGKAAQDPQNWRAAAWALERKFPNDYARRGSDVVTLDQLALLLSQMVDIVIEEVPEIYRKRIAKRLNVLTGELGIVLERKDDHGSD